VKHGGGSIILWGYFFSGRDWEASQDTGKDEWSKVQRDPPDSRLGRRITFQQDNDPKHTAKTTQEWIRDKSLNVLEWSSQSLDLNPIKHLWKDMTKSVQRHTPSNLTELERICREEWEKLPKYRCHTLVVSYPFLMFNKLAKMSITCFNFVIMGYCV
jgi:hypothetical protein